MISTPELEQENRNLALRGVVPPLLTPFTQEDEVDEASLRKQVDRLIAAGVDALFALGSTGETVFLTREDRKKVIATIIDQAAGRVPVAVGLIDTTTPRVLQLAADAVELGAHALVVTAPFYVRISRPEIERHFRLIHEAFPETPIFAYNIPVSVHVVLDPELLITLARDGVLAGVKDSGGVDGATRALVEARDAAGNEAANFAILTGSEMTVDLNYFFGVDGVVPGLGNVDPAGYVELARAATAGQWERAREEQQRLNALMQIAFVGDLGRMGGSAAGVGGFKAAMHHLGVFETGLMAPPHTPLNEQEIAKIGEIVDAAEIREPQAR